MFYKRGENHDNQFCFFHAKGRILSCSCQDTNRRGFSVPKHSGNAQYVGWIQN